MTSKCVTDEQYGRLWRRLKELARRVDEGSLPFEVTMRRLQTFIQPDLISVCFEIDSTRPFDYDKTRDGWTHEIKAGVQDGEVTLGLVSFIQEGESSVPGDEMVRLAKENDAMLGQRHAEALLRNQDKIPEEWRDYILVFPGDVWRDPHGRRVVPYLCWYGGRWYLHFCWLESGFYSRGRLLRSYK